MQKKAAILGWPLTLESQEKNEKNKQELRRFLEKMSQIMVLCNAEFNLKYRTLHHPGLQKPENAR